MRTIRTDLASLAYARDYVYPLFRIPYPDADPTIDLTFVAGDDRHPQAVLLARPVAFCHRFYLSPDLPPSARLAYARSLMAFAQGYACNRDFKLHGSLFQVAEGNLTMQDFARTLGGCPSPGHIYRIDHA